MTLRKEEWRENCGGFFNKLMAEDQLVAAAIAEHRRPSSAAAAPYFDAIVPAEHALHDRTGTLARLGFGPPCWFATGAQSSTSAAEPNVTRTEVTKVCGAMPFLCRWYGVTQ